MSQNIMRGDVWYVESGYTTGSEQRPGRPAVIVSNDLNNKFSECVEVVYLTTQPKKDLPTHAPVRSVGRGSTAICEQITSVALERISTYKGHVTDEEMAAIDAAMLVSLALGGLADFEREMMEGDTPAPAPAPAVQEDPLLSVKLTEAATENAELKRQLTEAEARCAVLQQLYDGLLGKVLKVSVGGAA